MSIEELFRRQQELAAVYHARVEDRKAAYAAWHAVYEAHGFSAAIPQYRELEAMSDACNVAFNRVWGIDCAITKELLGGEEWKEGK